MKTLLASKPVLTAISKLKLAEYNPRTISERERQALRTSILSHGFVVPIVVQKSTMTIIGGHQRVDVLQEMEQLAKKGKLLGSDDKPIPLSQVPTQVYAVLMDVNDDEAKRLNVALNRISGEFDDYKLGELFSTLTEATEFEVLAMGFEQHEFDSLIEEMKMPEELADQLEKESSGIVGEFARSITLTLEFETVKERDEAKEKLRAICKPKGIKAGNLLLAALNKGKLGKVPELDD